MLTRFRNWFSGTPASKGEVSGEAAESPLPRVDNRAPRAAARSGERPAADSGSGRPAVHATAQRQFLREDTGTYETLKIVDDSLVDNNDDAGIDPYNTGDFDRARNWDKHHNSK